MLTTEDILHKVRELEIRSKRLSANLFTGEYHAAFKGRGMRFREVREYCAGDDIRFIDWNVSARFSHPFTKVFEEERELSVMLLVDISQSSLFGTVGCRKRDFATEISAVLAFSAITNNDKVGAIFFSDRVEKYIPPKKGRQHTLYIVRELLGINPTGKGTQIGEAIRYFSRACKQKSIAFILSDFNETNYENDLKVANARHEVVGVRIFDPMDMQLPDAGLLQLEDLESGELSWVDTGDPAVRYQYHQDFLQQSLLCKQYFRQAGADLLHISTAEDYVTILQQFFIHRS